MQILTTAVFWKPLDIGLEFCHIKRVIVEHCTLLATINNPKIRLEHNATSYFVTNIRIIIYYTRCSLTYSSTLTGNLVCLVDNHLSHNFVLGRVFQYNISLHSTAVGPCNPYCFFSLLRHMFWCILHTC